jgi:hypothetical protein
VRGFASADDKVIHHEVRGGGCMRARGTCDQREWACGLKVP